MSKTTTARLALAGILIASLITPASTSLAWDQRIERDTAHFSQCLDWLVNDPARWARNCQPSRPAEIMEGPSPNMTNPWIPPGIAPTADECEDESGPVMTYGFSSTGKKGKKKGWDKCDDDGHDWGGPPKHYPPKFHPPKYHPPKYGSPKFGPPKFNFPKFPSGFGFR